MCDEGRLHCAKNRRALDRSVPFCRGVWCDGRLRRDGERGVTVDGASQLRLVEKIEAGHFRYFVSTITGSAISRITSWAGKALRWPKPPSCFSPEAKVAVFQSVHVSKIPVYVNVKTLDFIFRCASLICCSTRSMCAVFLAGVFPNSDWYEREIALGREFSPT